MLRRVNTKSVPTEKTLSALASEPVARLPTMTDEEQRLGLEIYRHIAHGEPVRRADLAEALPHSVRKYAVEAYASRV